MADRLPPLAVGCIVDNRRREFLTVAEPTLLSSVVAIVVEVLRQDVTQAWIDAFTDGPWRPAQLRDVAALRALEVQQLEGGQRRKQTGMGIDLDLARDEHFEILVRLSSFTIHAEAWAGGEAVFSVSDTGDHAWFALTPDEERQAAQRLHEQGLSFWDLLVPPDASGGRRRGK